MMAIGIFTGEQKRKKLKKKTAHPNPVKHSRQGNYSKKSVMRPGHVPIPEYNIHTTINEWHTCPNDGEIKASNPCSEYMFLDDTACNLASLNLVKFYDSEVHRQFQI